MKFLVSLCLFSCLLGCGNFVTREELQRSQVGLRDELHETNLAVHTCAQTTQTIQMFLMICQHGSAGHCAAVESWLLSCQGADAQDNLVLPEAGVWERVMASGMAAEQRAQEQASQTPPLDSEEAAVEEQEESTTP